MSFFRSLIAEHLQAAVWQDGYIHKNGHIKLQVHYIYTHRILCCATTV